MTKYFTFLFLIILTAACAQKDFLTKYTFAQKTFIPKKYYYTLTNNSQTIVDAPNNKTTINNSASISFYYQISADSSGNKIVKITYNKFSLTIKKNDEDAADYSSENIGESSTIMDRVLTQIKGNTITITADKNGKVLGTTGAKDITDKIAATIPNYEDGSNELIKKRLDDFIGAKFINDNILQNLSLVPDSALSIGSTWSNKKILTTDIPINTTINYTLEAVENGVGTIQSSCIFNTTIDKPITILGMSAATDLKGNITGMYKIQENTGIVLNATTKLVIEGSLNISNQTVPVSIKITKKITAKDEL